MRGHSDFLCGTWYRNTKYPPQIILLLDNIMKSDHYTILFLTTAFVNKNINFRHPMVLIVWLIILPPVIYPTEEVRGNVVHPIISLKFSPNINKTYFIWIIMNTQAINIGRRQVICGSGIFSFESWQNDIMAHAHSHFNILCVGACFSDLFWIVWFFIVPSYHQLQLFENIIKGRSALILRILYFAHPIQNMWWHPGLFHPHQQHHLNHRHHNNNHQLNHLIFHLILS